MECSTCKITCLGPAEGVAVSSYQDGGDMKEELMAAGNWYVKKQLQGWGSG